MFKSRKLVKELARAKSDKRFWETNWYSIRKALKECLADGTISPEIYEQITSRASDITFEQLGIVLNEQG